MKNPVLRIRIKTELIKLLTQGEAEIRDNLINYNASLHLSRKLTKRLNSIISLLKNDKSAKPLLSGVKYLLRLNKESSDSRDAFVLQNLLEELVKKENNDSLTEILMLTEQTRKENAELISEVKINDYLNKYLNAFIELKNELNEHQLSNTNLQMIKSAIKDNYREGLILLKKSSKSLNIRTLHRWRKSVKQMQYTFEFLGYTGCGKLKKYIKSLDQIAKQTGYVHDLDNLIKYFNKRRVLFYGDLNSLVRYMDSKMQKTYNRSVKKGTGLYKKELSMKKIGKLLSRNNFK